jgi:hypothetical protein
LLIVYNIRVGERRENNRQGVVEEDSTEEEE